MLVSFLLYVFINIFWLWRIYIELKLTPIHHLNQTRRCCIFILLKVYLTQTGGDFNKVLLALS